MDDKKLTQEQLIEWDRRFLWHPFTPMKSWMEKADPLIIVRGQGEFLFDLQGRRYIDGVSSLWCNVHGHGVKELDEAVRTQLNAIAHTTLLGLGNVPSIVLAKRLIDIAPAGLTRVFYSDDGSTAVEVACKMAFQYWRNVGQAQRTRFIAFHDAYHGDTLGAVSLGGIPAFHQVYQPLCFPVDRVAAPRLAAFSGLNAAVQESLGAQETLAPTWIPQMESLLARRPGQYVGIVVEPVIQGAGGMVMHPPGTLQLLRQFADAHDLLLICDEVLTGFGRTGRMFACDHENITPDLMCLSKGLTGGYMPLGATLTTDRIFAAFYADPKLGKTFYHGHTFTGHPLACAVAIASLDLFEQNRLLQHVATLAPVLWQQLNPLRDLRHVMDVRQTGLVAAIDIARDRRTGERFPAHWRVGGALCTAMRRRGVLLRPLADTLVIMPPLTIGLESLAQLTDAVVESVQMVEDIALHCEETNP